MSALLCFVISRWDDFALLLSGRNGALPASIAGTADGGHDFLIEFKLDREKVGKEQVDMLKVVMDDKEAGKDVRDAARAQYPLIVDAMGKELKIEASCRLGDSTASRSFPQTLAQSSPGQVHWTRRRWPRSGILSAR